MIDFSMRTATIRGNPGARFLRNIQLPVADGRPHSITCFCHFAGTDSIQIDGDTHSRIGDPVSYSSPVTFYLQPDEVVDTVYGLIRGSGFADIIPCPSPFALVSLRSCFKCLMAYSNLYLQMRTTMGRYLYFAPFLLGPSDSFMSAVMQYGSESTHRATGLFFDALNSYISINFYDDLSPSMGVIQELRPEDATPPTDTAPSLSFPATLPWVDDIPVFNPSGTILNRATLEGAQEIVQQKEGNRVRGLRARFPDDRLIVLGGWDPSNGPDAFTTIFSTASGVRLRCITFVMSHLEGGDSEEKQVVKEIVVNGGYDMDQANVFNWERLDQVW